MSEVKRAGQKTSSAEQGTPCGAPEEKKLYDLWKQGQALQEDYRAVVHIWRQKAQLELKLASVVSDNKKAF